ncbi:hypothetical protein [Haloparvum sp. AD34]
MSYSPDIKSVYEKSTAKKYYNHSLAGTPDTAFSRSSYVLLEEFAPLQSAFSLNINGHAQFPVSGQSVDDAKSDAYVYLSRYLSALYNTTESIEWTFAQAAGVPPDDVHLQPDLQHPQSRWNKSQKQGQSNPSSLPDPVIGSFLYLIGIRNVVIHSSLGALTFEHKQNPSRLLVQLEPSKMDSDPSLRHVDGGFRNQYTFSPTDQYLRFEKNYQKIKHPIDYILADHQQYILPYLKEIASKL